MTSTQPQLKAITLTTSNDWDEWIYSMEGYAVHYRVWEYIDPTKETLPVRPLKPNFPTLAAISATARFDNLTEGQRYQFRYLTLEYQTKSAEYEQIESAMRELYKLIMNSISRQYVPFIMGQTDPKEILKTLQTRIAPTDRARKLETTRRYRTLNRGPQGQQTEKWLQLYEKTFKEAETIKLPDVTGEQPLYDFLAAIKVLDPHYSETTQVILTEKIKNDKTPTFYDMMDDYRHHRRLAQATMGKPSHSAFATFQGRSQDQPRETSPTRSCICGEIHFFSNCNYLIENIRPADWKPDPEIQKKINDRLQTDPRFREAVMKARSRRQRPTHKSKDVKPHASNNTTIPTSDDHAKTLGSFAVHRSLATHCAQATQIKNDYKLRTCWILDSGSDTHLCNERSRFTPDRLAGEDDIIYSGKEVYPIEAYGTSIITVDTPQGEAKVTLVDVAFVPGFFANLVSLKRFTRKGVHWDTQNNRLHRDGTTFCWVTPLDDHWVLETPKSPTHHAFFSQRSANPRPPLSTSAAKWHDILGHPSREVLTHLKENTEGVNITTNDAPSTTDCETCSMSKAHSIISRRSTREYHESEPFERVAFDLIVGTVGYNSDKWITHFRCFFSAMNFVYTHPKKSQTIDAIKEFINMVEKRFQKKIKYLRTDTEQTLGSVFDALVADKGITVEKSAPYTPAQNGMAERSGGLLIIKARAMRLHAKLPADLWPEIFKSAGYLLNRTPTRHLKWKTPFEVLTGQKPNLSHLHIYGCRAYPLRHKIPRSLKLDPRAHIGYLLGYDSTNIFKIWIPSLGKVIRTRDVTFNDNLFYTPSELDLGHICDETPQLVEFLAVPSSPVPQQQKKIFFLEDANDVNFELSPKGHTLKEPAHDLTLYPTPSPTLDPDPDNIGLSLDMDMDFDLDMENMEKGTVTHEAVEDIPPVTSDSPDDGENRFESDNVNGVDSQVDVENRPLAHSMSRVMEHADESGFIRSSEESQGQSQSPRLITNTFSHFTTDNILPDNLKRKRKQGHLEALSKTHDLSGFHTALAVALQSPKKFTTHRDEMPPEPRTWQQMQKHQYANEFSLAAYKEYSELLKKNTFSEIRNSDLPPPKLKSALPLTWVFKYKFDNLGHILKFKARLCVRGDLQNTEKETYAATLAGRTFRALMAITAAFDLECLQYDAVNAFVNAEIDEELYCQYPRGFEKPGMTLRLRRALYGLKQSPRLWYRELTSTLETLGLSPILDAECLFANDWLIVFFYVDDILVMFSDKFSPRFPDFEKRLRKCYEIRSIGPIKWFLGIQIIRDREGRKLWLSQASYVTKIATRFHLTTHKPENTPLPTKDLLPHNGKATAQQVFAYQQRVGSINFAATTTRPDVAFAASKLAQFLLNPSSEHMAAADRTIIYLYTTMSRAIEYDGNENYKGTIFMASADASFADDKMTRHSSDGYLFKLYGGPIDWKASKQKTITLSSSEAEFLSLTRATRELIWWKRFFDAIHFNFEHELTICCDNTQAIRIAREETPKLITKLRHVDIHQSWLREQVRRRLIYVQWVPTTQMPADGMTKALAPQRQTLFIKHLNLTNISALLTSTDSDHSPAQI